MFTWMFWSLQLFTKSFFHVLRIYVMNPYFRSRLKIGSSFFSSTQMTTNSFATMYGPSQHLICIVIPQSEEYSEVVVKLAHLEATFYLLMAGLALSCLVFSGEVLNQRLKFHPIYTQQSGWTINLHPYTANTYSSNTKSLHIVLP